MLNCLIHLSLSFVFFAEPPIILNCTKIINNTYLEYGAVSEKDHVKLMCNMSGSKPLNVSWRYGSKVWNQEYLKLPSINRKDAGTYEIRVKSGGMCNETAKQNMTLEVYCKFAKLENCIFLTTSPANRFHNRHAF